MTPQGIKQQATICSNLGFTIGVLKAFLFYVDEDYQKQAINEAISKVEAVLKELEII